jgi:hypothetical protein
MIRDAHNKLLAFLCLILVTGGMVTAGVAGARPDSTPPRSTVALTEAFDRIVPGMTQADDLPAMGFDAADGRTAMLPPAEIQRRFLSSTDTGIQGCIRAELYCTGFVFPTDAKGRVTLLVMNGRVVHKVFDGRPAGEAADPLQRLAALARDIL